MSGLPPPPPPSDDGLPQWVPEHLAKGFDEYDSMTEPEREAFAVGLTEYDRVLAAREEASKQRELRLHSLGLFFVEATEELAQAMNQDEGTEPPIEKASLVMMTSLSELAERARYRVRMAKGGVQTASDWTGWILLFEPDSIFGFIRATRNVCLHIAAGDKPRRFRKGWTKPG